MRRRTFIAGLAAWAPIGVHANSIVSNATALSGARFVAGDQEYLLADVLAPPFYSLTVETPPHFKASRQTLDALLSGPLELDDVMPATRWGVRRVSASRSGSEQTLQEVLVRDGAVRVAPESNQHERIAGLLAIEQQARAERRGLWALPGYQLFDASNAEGAIGGFHLIEGTVARAEKHGDRFYLNFGEDFRSDFTASAASALSRRWLKEGADLASFAGAQIRVRGFVDAINGPSIDLKHPMQIEKLL